jgi:hypothetical protein
MHGLLHGDHAVDHNFDARLEAFDAALDGTLLHNWQTQANGGWNV